MHVYSLAQQDFIRQRFEAPRATELTHDQKKVLFKRLIRSTKFEEFLAKKWPSEKRFGLEGCEASYCVRTGIERRLPLSGAHSRDQTADRCGVCAGRRFVRHRHAASVSAASFTDHQSCYSTKILNFKLE
jgi:hypothetical protein